MPGTMTFVGMDVHARSIHAAAIDVMSGELTRFRFRKELETPVACAAPVRSLRSATALQVATASQWSLADETLRLAVSFPATPVLGDGCELRHAGKRAELTTSEAAQAATAPGAAARYR